ncbi:MAG: Bro-N domain-containing protein [Rickettsiales bacterium]|jgi:hypothetical protein|nr:Bro-N domain-containing protein [Rickettsiales bacterium]
MNKNEIKLFQDKNIRTLWDETAEKWYFSVVDVVGALTDQTTQDGARNYWKVLKHRLSQESDQPVTFCNQLKMMSQDGKMRETDVADTAGILRLIQSVPSPKAEPFKLWLAKVGSDRIDEMVDPELAITRALEYYAKKGYSLDWINQRLKTIEVRKQLTDEWDRGGIKKGLEYALLTDELYSGWAGLNARAYKKLKGLTKENLRDNMSNMELVLNMLAELTITELASTEKPKGLNENMKLARRGGVAAGRARKEIEKETGKPAITAQNAKGLKLIGKK